MNKTEIEVARDHINWLTDELQRTQEKVKARDTILSDMLNPDVCGWAVPQEIRSSIYNLFSHEREVEVQSWNRK
jgi:hypothetical protein